MKDLKTVLEASILDAEATLKEGDVISTFNTLKDKILNKSSYFVRYGGDSYVLEMTDVDNIFDYFNIKYKKDASILITITKYDVEMNIYDMNDPDRVYAAEDKLSKINDVLWPALDNMIKEYSITEEILAENGLDIKTFTTYYEIILCMKELERRWNQTYDQNYKELQEKIREANRKIFDLEIENQRLEMEVEDYRKRLGEE